MNNSRLASRYAKALFSLAKERDQVEVVNRDLLNLNGLLKESPEFRWLLESPVIMATDKARIAETILKDLIEPITLDFVKLLLNHRREANFASTCRMFAELFKADQGILEANMESAVTVDPKFLEGLIGRLEASSHRKIEMKTETNEALIGGFILTLEDQQLDASVQSKLKRIRQELRESKK